jgi:CBS-domain-containing membrane protein
MSLPGCKDIPTNSHQGLIKLVWSVVGAAIAIGLALWLVADDSSLFLLASLGGSTVFLFALTDTEAAQPRALFGGHLAGAAIGIFCFQFFGDALWVSVAAVVLTMVFMMVTRTIHPPAGANPLFMVHYHASVQALLKPVGLGVFILFLVTVIWSRLRPGKRYPVKWWRK